MDEPIDYIKRTQDYYLALGYDNPYQWAHFEDVPFAPLLKPLDKATVAIVTTAAPVQPGKADEPPVMRYDASAKFFQVYSGSTKTMPALGITHVAIDWDHTTAEDIGTYFPLAALKEAARLKKIGQVAEKFYGLPTNRSQKTTLEIDCQDLLRRCRADGVDAVVLVPNCPVCHQSVSLAARTLEEAGIATVIMGCARDVVENVGVPRLLLSDFPLGNAAGRPNDRQSQQQTIEMALSLLNEAQGPRCTRQSPLVWQGPPDWKQNYSNPAFLSPDEIAQRRQQFDKIKQVAAEKRS